jgi:hypothetical protein
MAPVASSLATKLKDWVAINDAITTDGKVVICQVCDKKLIGIKHAKCYSYRTQRIAVLQEAGTSDPNATRLWNQE